MKILTSLPVLLFLKKAFKIKKIRACGAKSSLIRVSWWIFHGEIFMVNNHEKCSKCQPWISWYLTMKKKVWYTRHTVPPVALCCQGAAVDVPPATTRCLVHRRATCTPPRQPTAAQRLMYRKFLAPEVAEACPDQNESRFSRINAIFSCGKQIF